MATLSDKFAVGHHFETHQNIIGTIHIALWLLSNGGGLFKRVRRDDFAYGQLSDAFQ